MKQVAWCNDAKAVALVGGFLLRDFKEERPQVAADPGLQRAKCVSSGQFWGGSWFVFLLIGDENDIVVGV